MNRARVDLHCDQVYSMGITGRGIGVAVLDTGIFLHEDLKDRVKAVSYTHLTLPTILLV